MQLTYTVREVTPYINWVYYFHAWGMGPRFASVSDVHDCVACRAGWVASFPVEEQPKAREAIALYEETKELLCRWADQPICHALFLLADAYSDGDNIVVNDTVCLPFLRQQRPGREGYTLCLSDFIRPKNKGANDRIGVFVATVSQPDDSLSPFSDFQFDTLADRLAEAAAERMHEEVRKRYWGYAKEEQLTMRELHEERFQGIRPAVGYPCLPDQSINFLIDQLLHFEDVGVSLSENGAMIPHSSVSGLMLAHPKACYFSVGDIGEDQLRDYSFRRGLDADMLRNFLATNLKNRAQIRNVSMAE